MGRLREANVLGVVVNGEDSVHDANDAFLDIIGYSREDLEAGRISCQVDHSTGMVRTATPTRWRSCGAPGPSGRYEKEYVHRDGHRVPVLIGAAVISRHPLRWVTFVVDLTARQRAERGAGRAAGPGAGRPGRGGRRQGTAHVPAPGRRAGRRRAGPPRDASARRPAGRAQPGRLLRGVPARPRTARCGPPRIAHRDPARGPVSPSARRARSPLSARWSVTAGLSHRDQPAGAGRRGAAGRGGTSLAPTLARHRWPGCSPSSVLFTPLHGGPSARSVSSPSAATPTSPASPTPTSRWSRNSARQTGRRAGQRGHLRPRAHHGGNPAAVRAARRAAQPSPGWTSRCATCPATDGVDVGGDWYDAFPLDGGRVGLVIGDVVGHNIGSASIMGQVRSLLRAYAIDHPQPRRGAAAHQPGPWPGCCPTRWPPSSTRVLDPATGELSYANAGHPPPVWASARARPGTWTTRRGDARRPGRRRHSPRAAGLAPAPACCSTPTG